MEQSPDSALKILQQIPDTAALQGRQRADYAILMAQALDENYLPLDSLGMIGFAVDYYKDSGDKVAAGKAYYYYGIYLFGTERYEDALVVFLKACELIENTDQYRLLGLIHENTGNVNFYRRFYDMAIQSHKTSFYYYTLIKDTLSMSYALRNMGKDYLLKEEMDSCFFYCDKALDLVTGKGLRSEFVILQELGMAYRESGNYEKAEYYLLKAIDLASADRIAYVYLSLGKLYIQMGRDKDAEELLNRCLNSGIRTDTKIAIYVGLAELARKRGDFKKTDELTLKRDSLIDFLEEKNKETKNMELQQMYEKTHMENKYLRMRNAKNNIIWLSVFFSLLILVVAAYYYSRSITNRKKIREIERAIFLNEEEIAGYKNELLRYSNTRDKHLDEIGALQGKMALLAVQNQNLMEHLTSLGGNEKSVVSEGIMNPYAIALRSLVAIKSGKLNRNLSDEEVTELFALFDFFFDGFATRLTTEFSDLTKHDIELCCLLKIKCTNEELCRIFSAIPNSMRKAKTRVKKRLNVPDDESLELFLYRY